MFRIDPSRLAFPLALVLVVSVFALAGLWGHGATEDASSGQAHSQSVDAGGSSRTSDLGRHDHSDHDHGGQGHADHTDAHGADDAHEDWSPGDGLRPWGLVKGQPPQFVHEHALPAGEGKVPSRSTAMEFSDRYNSLHARGSDALDRLAQRGHLSGSGTVADPYVLERFYVDGDLVLQSIDRAIVIREGYVTGQMKLNYIGSDVLVHHVYAEDLRVNENVRRSGLDTGGLFHDNAFGFIGQLRHFSGEFRDNQVGPKPQGVAMTYLADTGIEQVPPGRVFNFDGFHGASVHSNTIHGRVDIKLHGHYHGDCLACASHDHANESHFPPEHRDNGDNETGGDEAGHDHGHDGHVHYEHEHERSHHGEASDKKREWLEQKGLKSHHSIRYHSLHFYDNEIHVELDELVALRYYDRAHRGDDETANSEPNPYLEDPHVHYQYILLEGNTLYGGGLVLDVFNAKDDRHVVANQGVFHVEGNQITVGYTASSDPPRYVFGMHLKQGDGIEMLVRDNTIAFERHGSQGPVGLLEDTLYKEPDRFGIYADRMERGNLTFRGNTVEEGNVGLYARLFADQVWWFLQGNDFRTEHDIWDEQNKNPPTHRGGGA